MRSTRSLYHNRARLNVLQDRIERAEGDVVSYLALYGLAATVIGNFQVVLDGDDLYLTRLPDEGAQQLQLPELDMELGSPEEGGGPV
jgi:hypothetical protein